MFVLELIRHCPQIMGGCPDAYTVRGDPPRDGQQSPDVHDHSGPGGVTWVDRGNRAGLEHRFEPSS